MRVLALVLVAHVSAVSACSLDLGHDSMRDDGFREGPYWEIPFSQDLGDTRVLGRAVRIHLSEVQEDADWLAPNNLGISFESTDLADPRWDPEAGNLDELLAELGSPGLRFGGNELDRLTFWTSTGETPPPGHATVTPEDLERVNSTVEKLGSDVTLGIPLGDFDPGRGADMASHAVDIFGDSLLAISVGNEPNGYTADGREGLQIREPGGWDEERYISQVDDYVNAITSEVGTAVPLVGPGAFDGAWMTAFLDADLPGTVALSQHWYATFECASQEVPGRGPEWENLVDPHIRDSAERLLSIGLEKADVAGVPLWVEETGPTSCPGTNDTSRTHASALWTVDYILQAAQLGVERMGMHSMLGACVGGAPMSVVCSAEGDGEQGAGEILGQPNHSAMKLARLSVGGTFVETSAGGNGIQSYAVKGADHHGDDALAVTVVNTNDMANVGGNRVTVEVPDGYVADQAAQIYAPSNAAVSETGYRELAPFAESGSGVVSSKAGELVIDLAASSATMIVFTPASPAA